MMKLLYKPFGIIGGIVAGRIGRSVFESVWSAFDDAPPPLPGSGEGGVVKMIGGQALRAGVMAGSAAAVDRVFAGLFHHLIGAWPAREPQQTETSAGEAE